MKLKQFCAVALMSVLIISVSALLTYVRDIVFAQGQVQSAQGQQQSYQEYQIKSGGNGPALAVPVLPQPPKWLVSFYNLPNEQAQLITVVDPETQRIAVYKVWFDEEYKIQLKSVREIAGDLKLRVYNGADPLPEFIDKTLRELNQ
ncbi:MAG: hypothetical protein ACRC2T_08205 [Thermoguttaceae bacterium]